MDHVVLLNLAVSGPNQSLKMRCPDVVFVCAITEIHLIVDWRLLVEEHIANIGIPLYIFGYIPFHVSGSLQTSLLCIIGELAWEGSMAVAVSDR